MPKTHSILHLHKPDPHILVRVERLEGLCLAAAMVLAFAAAAGELIPAFHPWLAAWLNVPVTTSIAALACAAGLALATVELSRGAKIARTCLGALTAVAGLLGLLHGAMALLLPATGTAAPHAALSRLVACSFVCLGTVVVFAQARNGPEAWASDAALFGAGWVVLTLMAGSILGGLRLFGDTQPDEVAPLTTGLLTLLAASAAARRAEYGSLSIFVGRGLGSRIARVILPVVMLLPVSRELMRARFIRHHVFPEHYAAACLAAAGTMVALGLLLWVSWQLRRLEWEIQSLSLRDELTGLYNLRGFHLLAEQSLRMARRSRLPFSVLFVDVDNLKLVNDRLGHAAGSQLLVQAAEFLKINFRETDVIGRIGGDEFAVAGQFSAHAIEMAENRLELDTLGRELPDTPSLSLSMGHATADPKRIESLQDLLDRADAAMYERKRLKKLQTI